MRGWLLAGGSALAAGGLLVVALLGSLWWDWQLAILGLLVVAAVLIERRRYRAVGRDRPGPGWQKTGERFVDPETGRIVTVYFHPDSGERRYVGS